LISQETVSQMHALFLAAGVNGYDSRVNDDDNTNDEVVLLENAVGHQGYEVEGFVLVPIQLHDDYQQVRPCEHSTGNSVTIIE